MASHPVEQILIGGHGPILLAHQLFQRITGGSDAAHGSDHIIPGVLGTAEQIGAVVGFSEGCLQPVDAALNYFADLVSRMRKEFGK